MAAETIKEFLVGLGFKVDQAGLRRFASGIASASAKAAALGAAVTAAAGAIVAGVKNIAEGYDELDRLGETYRTTAAEIDAFIDTAQILGISNEKAKDSLKALDNAIVDTSMGMGRAAKVFEELGIEVTNADGSLKSTTAVMGELVTELDKVERGKRVRILERLGLDPATMRVFGKDFAGCNADLQALQKDLADIDSSVGFNLDSAVKGSKEFMLSWRAMGREVEKWRYLFSKAMTSVALKLLPQFREQLRRITGNMLELRRRTMEHMPRIIESIMPVVRAIMRVAEAFLRIAYRIGQAAMTIINWLLRLNKATGGWLLWIGLAAAAWMKLNLAFLSTPLGQLLTLAAILALLVDDFLTWKEGGESLIDWGSGFGKVMAVLTAAIAGFLTYVVASKVAIVALTAVTTAWAAITKAAAAVMATIRAAVLAFNIVLAANPVMLVVAAIAALIAIGYVLVTNWETVKEWLAAFFAWLVETFPALGGVFSAAADVARAAGAALVSAWEAVKGWFDKLFAWFAERFPATASAIQAAVDVIGAAGSSLVAAWEAVKSWFSSFFSFLSGGFAQVAQWTEKIGGAITGAWGKVRGMFGGGVNAPAPSKQAQLGGKTQNVSQQTIINVSGAQNPQGTAQAVARAQRRVNADMTRNMRRPVQ